MDTPIHCFLGQTDFDQFGGGLFPISIFLDTAEVQKLWTKQRKTCLSIKLSRRHIGKRPLVTEV